MTVAPIPLLLAAFRDEDQAGHFLTELEDRHGDGPSGIVDAATLAKDDTGRLTITNAHHRDARGLFVGGIVGTFIGGVAGPAVATAVGGSVLGGLRGRLQSAPLKFELLAVGEELPPRSSLLIAVAERGWADRLSSELHAAAGLVLTYELRPSVVDQLNEGGNVAFPFATTGAPPAGHRRVPASDVVQRVGRPLHNGESIAVSAATLTDEVLLSVGGPGR